MSSPWGDKHPWLVPWTALAQACRIMVRLDVKCPRDLQLLLVHGPHLSEHIHHKQLFSSQFSNRLSNNTTSHMTMAIIQMATTRLRVLANSTIPITMSRILVNHGPYPLDQKCQTLTQYLWLKLHTEAGHLLMSISLRL